MIAIVDFGSQYTHLITRRVRELGVRAEIFEHDITAEALKDKNVEGIILSGGPATVFEKNAPTIDKNILQLGIPVLGICYGHQLLAYLSGGKVAAGKNREYGEETIEIINPGILFDTLPSKETVWFSHGVTVFSLPKDFEVLARTKTVPIASFCNRKQLLFGVQFHPEVAHTLHGTKILKNFLFGICHAKKTWRLSDIKGELISGLKQEIKGEKIMIGVSGGVDSTVAAKLLHEAVGEQVIGVFIDTGLLRKNEVEEVTKNFKALGFKHFKVVSAGDKFLSALAGIIDPEEKRKAFAKTYFQVFVDFANGLEKTERASFLAQGTIYPDRIESGKASKASSLIKSHHNLSIPEALKLTIIEPLKDLYKDEVRILGKSLGLPERLLSRHPFPGPGLAIRILGEVTRDRIRLLQEADHIFIEELRNFDYYRKVWQAFAALLPVKSVGVMGDERTYEYIVSLRAVTSKDAMTADWAHVPDSLLKTVSLRITNQVKGVNRVLYDISQKPPATIEYE